MDRETTFGTTDIVRARSVRSLFVHLRLHYQFVFLSPLFAWGFLLGGARFSWRAAVGFVSFHAFLYAGITAYNSYYDRDTGPVGGLWAPPLVDSALLPFSLAVQACGFVLALWVGYWFSALYVAVILLSVAYSHPKLRWKARPLLSLGIVALGQGAIGYLGGWLCASPEPRSLLHTNACLGLVVATLSAVGLYPLTQIYQIEEDRARGDRTFAVAFGPLACFSFALVCIALAGMCIAPLAFRLFGRADALLLGTVYSLLFMVVAQWKRSHASDVRRNFVELHRLQLALSLGTLGYMLLRAITL